jgi:hypothetical protein
METLKIDMTLKSPEVLLKEGNIKIKGRSILENSVDFYKPVLKWLDNYNTTDLIVDIHLEYFNTSSSKCFIDILKKIEDLNCKSIINWYYDEDDEDILEAGEDYQAFFKLPFKFIEVEI